MTDEQKPLVNLPMEAVACPLHMEPFRTTWPSGWAGFLFVLFEAAVKTEEPGHPPDIWRVLFNEEAKELREAFELAIAAPDQDSMDIAAVARECADVVYVVYGIAWLYRIDLDAALREVHRAAMDKMDANVRRDDGKIVKPPGFVPPDMTKALGG